MNWRIPILAGLDPHMLPLLLIADPDGLLRDAHIALELQQRGYQILPYDDAVRLRLAYEEQREAPCILVLWGRQPTLANLPYDLLAQGATRTIRLADLFPRLHTPLLSGLTHDDLDRLWPSYGQRRGTMLSAAETAESILQICYNIGLNALQSAADGLATLLQLHNSERQLPLALAERLQAQLASIPATSNWPLEELVQDRAAFEQWLSRAWPPFLLNGHLQPDPHAERRLEELRASYHALPQLPFDDPRIWPIVDTLFLAGRLRPFVLDHGWTANEPYAIGVVIRPPSTYGVERQDLAQQLNAELPSANAEARDWLNIAPLLGEWWAQAQTTIVTPEAAATNARLRQTFATWVVQRYATLLHTAPLPHPKLVSHLAPWLAFERQRSTRRQALLVMDGLALDQWVVIRNTWRTQGHRLPWDERAIFAWLPTITSISRQAIFAGTPPTHFAHSIERTDREAAHWQHFWFEQGLQRNAVAYQKGLHGLDPAHAGNELQQIEQMVTNPEVQIIGLVIDTVDQIAHGMRQGELGMLHQVEQWAKTGWLAELINKLQREGFQITLTADHGNVEARGIGRPADGIVAENRGQRVRIYRDQTLRDRQAAQHSGCMAWQGHGLPPELAILLAGEGEAFVSKGERVVAHGGADPRELLVPWCILA